MKHTQEKESGSRKRKYSADEDIEPNKSGNKIDQGSLDSRPAKLPKHDEDVGHSPTRAPSHVSSSIHIPKLPKSSDKSPNSSRKMTGAEPQAEPVKVEGKSSPLTLDLPSVEKVDLLAPLNENEALPLEVS